jgi:hypothetical protein
MTTPHQGPGMWQQGNREQALEWLANLDPRQQQALQRSIQTHQALGPIYNATNRVIQSAQRTATRLSEYAQRLATGARDFATNTVRQAGAATDRAVEYGQERVAAAREMGERGRDNVSAAAGRTVDAVTDVANKAVDGVTAAGRGAANAGRQVANAGRQAVAAGQNAVGKVSRWFKEKQTNTSIRANAARAAFQAFRTDPALEHTVSSKDVKVLSEQAAAIGTAKNWDELNAAIQQFGQSADQRLGTQSPQGQGTLGQGAQAGADKANNPAWALQGTADPRGAVTQAPGAQAAGAQGQQNQGEAAKTTGGKHRAGPETER